MKIRERLEGATGLPRRRAARRWLHGTASLLLAAGIVVSTTATGADWLQFERVSPQFIAALGDPAARAGSGAQAWGLWSIDPGPRGVWLRDHAQLSEPGGATPAGWAFDESDWWLEEWGRIMEGPSFPLPPGKYVVTGGRDVTAVLTIHPPAEGGASRWELADGARLHDVTHLGCRSARYTPVAGAGSCSPARARESDFPVPAGGVMPEVPGCHKQDYHVLIVVGVGG